MKQKDGLMAKRVGISLVVVMSMLFSGFAFLAAPVAVAQEMGGEFGGDLRVALSGQPSSLNPLAASLNAPAVQVIDIMYESMGRIDPYSLELIPWMASDWEVDAADESIVTITLRNGIMWHDGTDVTVADVAYTFGADGYDIDYISTITTDAANNSVIFDLAEPDARFFSQVMTMKVVKNGFTATSEPMGCGPYELESTGAEETVVVAFDDHFISRPYMDSIVFTYYPYTVGDFSADYPYSANFGNEDPRWDGTYRASYDLINSNLDFIGWGLSTNQTTQSIEVAGNYTTLILNANSTVQRSNGLNTWYLGFNNMPGHLFNDVAVRKAVTYSINKAGLTQYDISGGLEQTESVISKYNVPWYNNSISPYGFDMSEAKSILDNAGYMDYNGDGWVEKPDGSTFNLTLLGPPQGDVTPYTMSTNIITWLHQLGLNVALVSNTSQNHRIDILADDFDMFLADETSGSVDPQFIYNLYHSEATTTNILNFADTYSIVNESKIEVIDNATLAIPLNYSNVMEPIHVYHNDSLVSNTSYTVDFDAGIITMNAGFVIDFENDTVNVSYVYRPFDHNIEKAGEQMEPADRAKYIKDAQAAIADLCPSVPLFSYRINHAYLSGSYVGWVKTLGGLANYWTYTTVKNKLEGELDVTLSSFRNYITEGESMDLFIKVQDLNGATVDNAMFDFVGDGTFGEATYDGIGEQYKVSFTAPVTTVSKTMTISVNAYAAGYKADSDDLDITIHPLVSEFNLEVIRGATALDSGNSTTISVIVTDKATSQAISGATVVLTLSPAGLGGALAELTGTTDAAGEFVTTFSSDNVTVDTTFRITAYVTMEGYEDADASTSISVARDPSIEAVTTDSGFLGLPAPSLLVVLVLMATMSMIYAAYRRRE